MQRLSSASNVPIFVRRKRPQKTKISCWFAFICEIRLRCVHKLTSLLNSDLFQEGIAGHITVRDTEKTDHFWVNPFGKDFAQIRISDLVLVSSEGKVVEGKHPINNAAFIIHSRIHQARPEVIAVAHAHSTYGKAWSTLRRLLSPLTQDSCAFFKDHGIFFSFFVPFFSFSFFLFSVFLLFLQFFFCLF